MSISLELPWNPKLILFSELIKGLKTLVSGLSLKISISKLSFSGILINDL